MGLGGCRTFADNIAFEGSVQMVVDTAGINAGVRNESDIVDE